MAKGKKVWIARSENGDEPEVEVWERRPNQSMDGDYYGLSDSTYLSYPFFRRMTGFILQPGECRRVRLSVKGVKE